MRICVPLGLTLLALAVLSSFAGAQVPFKRGDLDGDGIPCTMGDLAPYLTYLFSGLVITNDCLDAADVNDDGATNVLDMIDMIQSMTGEGPMPPAPGPDACGLDPTPSTLWCSSYDACDATTPLPVSTTHSFNIVSEPSVIGCPSDVFVLCDFSTSVGSVAGFTFSVCHDPALEFVQVVAGAGMTEIDFMGFHVSPTGWTMVCVPSITGGSVFDNVTNGEVAEATYVGTSVGTYSLEFCDGISPSATPASIGITSGLTLSERYAPQTFDGSTSILPEPTFRRGDTNLDGSYDIADPVFLLAALFSQGTSPSCEDAADANDDGALDLADPIFQLGSLFGGNDEPPPPGPTTCDIDPSDDDALGCELSCP